MALQVEAPVGGAAARACRQPAGGQRVERAVQPDPVSAPFDPVDDEAGNRIARRVERGDEGGVASRFVAPELERPGADR